MSVPGRQTSGPREPPLRSTKQFQFQVETMPTSQHSPPSGDLKGSLHTFPPRTGRSRGHLSNQHRRKAELQPERSRKYLSEPDITKSNLDSETFRKERLGCQGATSQVGWRQNPRFGGADMTALESHRHPVSGDTWWQRDVATVGPGWFRRNLQCGCL